MKVAIIGIGRVGSLIAIQLATRESCKEIVLIDKDSAKADKQAQDIDLISGNTKVYSGKYETTADSDLIVIAINSVKTEIEETVDQLKEVIGNVTEFNKEAHLLIVTQPIDLATYTAYKVSGFKKEKVIGIGTASNEIIFRSALAKELNYNANDLKITTIGEHGNNALPIFSSASLHGIPLDNLTDFDPAVLSKILEETKEQLKEDKEEKVNYIIPASITVKMIEAILYDTREVFTASFFLTGEYNMEETALSLPVVLGSEGILDVLNLDLSEEETKALNESANKIKTEITALEQSN